MAGTLMAGFYGKLPARGDFVSHGLPRDFVIGWDGWWQERLAAHQAALGPAWLELWLGAPVWRFALPPGLCGARALLGVVMPSVDRAGRYFPLALAVAGDVAGRGDLAATAPLLDALEAAGRTALELDTEPDALAGLVRQAVPDTPPAAWWPDPAGQARWWTHGSDHVAPCERTTTGLPDDTAFARMFSDG